MGWEEVDKPRSGGDSRFISLDDGETVTIRLLDKEPEQTYVHQVSQPDGEGGDIFRSIPATPDLDDDYINQHTNLYPARVRHAMRCVVYDDEGNPDRIQVLIGGVQIFRPLKRLHEKHGDTRNFDIDVTRYGEGRQTEYEVNTPPNQNEIDLEEWWDKMHSDSQWEWGSIFPPVTPEEQKQMAEDAGLQIEGYTPIEDMKSTLTREEALDVRFDFGQYGPDNYPDGKTVGEVLAIDAGYVRWCANNVTSNYRIAAACRRVVEDTGAIERNKPQKKVSSGREKSKGADTPADPPKTAEDTKETPGDTPEATREDWPLKQSVESYLARWFDNNGKKVDLALEILASEGKEWDQHQGEAVPIGEASPRTEQTDIEEEIDETPEPDPHTNGDMTRDELISEISQAFAKQERFQDAMEIVDVVKEHGDGRTRLKDMKVDQLRSLYDDVVV